MNLADVQADLRLWADELVVRLIWSHAETTG
jgi:hypothetical protein